MAIVLVFDPATRICFPCMVGVALIFGVLLVTPIGGADMPTVISLLNSYAGFSAALLGFVLNSKVLVVAGALDGSSGFILSVIMCKAMNRSFTNVMFGAFGQVQASAAAPRKSAPCAAPRPKKPPAILAAASTVVIVPGYGMAVAQAQHKVRELYDALTKQGVDVTFGIHPVAGRMPGHMNVLLAEADIPYDKLLEMDDINSELPQTDVALIIGANDVTNPAARTDQASPIYGMPILDVDKARTVMVIKRSMNPGFAGIDNPLYYLDKTLMLFGDAKGFVGDIVRELRRQRSRIPTKRLFFTPTRHSLSIEASRVTFIENDSDRVRCESTLSRTGRGSGFRAESARENRVVRMVECSFATCLKDAAECRRSDL